MNEGSRGRDANSILRERARALARTPDRSADSEVSLQVLEFQLARERYAVETGYVQEVYPFKSLTVLPSTPPFIAGVVNVRGRILPVLDLKVFFDLPKEGLTDLHRIVVVSGHDLEFGLLADVSVGVQTIAVNSLQPPPPTVAGIGADYMRGVTVDGLIVLDMERILADPRIIVNEEVEN
jgi:purine-binding chemotaxis protein CheW